MLGVSLGASYVSELDSSYCALDGAFDGMLEELALIVTLGFTDGEALGFGECIILGSAVDEVLGSTIRASDGTELGSIDGLVDGSNDGKTVSSLLVDSLG